MAERGAPIRGAHCNQHAPPCIDGGGIEATKRCWMNSQRILLRSTRFPLEFGNISGIGRSGTGVLKVDGKAVATQKMEHTIPFILQWDESMDIGSDTLTGVDDADYQPPFKFTGKIDKITLTINRPKLSPKDIEKLKAAERAIWLSD